MNEEMTLRKLLTGNEVTELRNVGSFVYKIKCKWENEPRKWN